MPTPEPPSDPTASSPTPRRLWRRLHLSTWLVLLVVALGLVLISIPAYEIRGARLPEGDPDGDLVIRCRHGWPWDFMVQYRDYAWPKAPPEPGPFLPSYWTDAPWATASNWAVTGKTRFELLHLVGDLAVALAILCVAGAGFEWWRRRRRRVWQFSLREMLVATLLLAGVLGWWKCRDNQFRREMVLAKQLGLELKEYPLSDIGVEYRGPTWLGRLVGKRHLESFNNVIGVNLGFGSTDINIRDDEILDIVADVDQMWPHLYGLTVSVCFGNVDRQLASLVELRELRLFGVNCNRISEEGLRDVGRLSELEKLDFRCKELPESRLAFVSQLPHLKVLILDCPQLRSDDLASMAKLTELRSLTITDAPHVDGEGLVHLQGLTQLQVLNLDRTGVTSEEAEDLEWELPDCWISWH
ncbi:MAG: hypothetical protein JW818_07235 [Pirellulales bacterium]|nr:hypothetical protein [Pirellulales bacterium]